MDKLKIYRAKRNFDVTSEPNGKKKSEEDKNVLSGEAKKRKREGSSADISKAKLTRANGAKNKEGKYEPARKKSDKKKKQIFCVQFHRARRDHFDFRLEWKGVLLSWAVPKGLSFNPRDKRLAVQVEDHPLDYASFEGMIPKGQYGGGSVMLWDYGTWEAVGDFANGLKKGEVKFVLHGKRLVGQWALVRLKDEKNWLVIKDRDEFAKDEDGISHFKTSVKSGRTSHEIERGIEGVKKNCKHFDKNFEVKKNPFQQVDVKLAKLAFDVPSGDEWIFEVKYDGFRIVALLENGKAKLVTRNGKDYTQKFPEITKKLEEHFGTRAVILDGEVIAVDDEGKSDFQSLQQHLKHGTDSQIVYMIFDLLAFDGEDLRNFPLIERKKKLEEILKKAPNKIAYCQHVDGHGKECFEAAKRMGFEGIVCKEKDSIYTGGRGEDWLKLKCRLRQEFVVGGYTKTDKKVDGFSALLLGYYRNGKLVFCGRVGTGFNAFDKKELMAKFKKLETKKSPFESEIKDEKNEKIFYVKCELVAEIQFAQMTKDGLLRQASFKGLRDDKKAKDVVFESEFDGGDAEEKLEDDLTKKKIFLDDCEGEQKNNKVIKNAEKIEKNNKNDAKKAKKSGKSDETSKNTVAGVKISSPNRVLYADKKITKFDVAKYYEAVAKRMLPLIEGRILSVVRCHKEASLGGFFKKHPLAKIDGIEIVKLQNDKGKSADYFYISSLAGLIGQVQLGTIEFHIWASKFDHLEEPDFMVFDLDPDEKMDIKKVRQGVRDLKKILDELELKSFLKTSGGKGYHIVVPFKQKCDWQTFHDFAENVAKLMENKWPKRYTTNIRKDSRKGKIFVDFMRNTRGATSVAPYSLRARNGAKVSMPISWSELGRVEPNGVDLFNALQRIKKPDPWKDFFNVSQTLN